MYNPGPSIEIYRNLNAPSTETPLTDVPPRPPIVPINYKYYVVLCRVVLYKRY